MAETTPFLQGLQEIAARHPRPRPFVDVGGLPWSEPMFSRHFLRTATRSARHTQREITFLEQHGVLAPGRCILDVACGGGRHSIAMARRGAVVTGLDLGPAAIALARQRASKAGLDMTFVQGDVRQLAYQKAFDAVTFIFGCFTEMSRADATEVLRRISQSLRPGGLFVLDVYAPVFFAALDGEQEWWVGQDFIAGRFPQLVLTEYFYYPREQTYARRDFICDGRSGEVHRFGVSGQAYDLPDLCTMLAAAALAPTAVYSGWRGEEVFSDSQMYVIVASKTA
ncbi:MAG: class I SAM-dependent methyltransferase [Candidatus Tectimicrobiota bacterium]